MHGVVKLLFFVVVVKSMYIICALFTCQKPVWVGVEDGTTRG